jgi:hypothetical protein
VKHPFGVKDTGLERYRSMEANSGFVFSVLLAVSVASWLYLEPAPIYLASCLVVGAFLFVGNLRSSEGKTGSAFAFAAVGIVAGVAFIPANLKNIESVLIAGSHVGLSLYGLITIRKLVRERRTGRSA